MIRVLFILNDAPYGSERSYNGFRLARSLSMREDTQVKVLLMGDAVSCALAGQKTPNGYYNLGRVIQGLLPKEPRSAAAAPVSTLAASLTIAWPMVYADRRSISSLSGRYGRIR